MGGFTLGRKIDLSYKTNFWLVVVTVPIFVLGWLITGEVVNGLSFAVGFFLCWALTRELDPANELSAFVAGGIFLLGTPLFDGVEMVILFWMILLVRFISKICGKNPTYFDLLTVTAITIFLLFSRGSSVFVLLFTIALISAYYRYQKKSVLGKFALFSLGVFLGSLFFDFITPGYLFTLNIELSFSIIFALLILGGGVLWLVEEKEEIRDDLGEFLEPGWIRLGQVFFLISFWFLLFFENLSFSTYFTLFSVMLGVFLYSFLVKKLLALSLPR